MDYNKARFNMVEQQIRPWDVLDFELLDVLEEIPREIFVDDKYKNIAYADVNIPLGNGSVMLEPKIVARMIQGLELTKADRVLEIGTRRGYATAILARLAKNVMSFDISPELQEKAKTALDELNILNVDLITADGFDDSHYKDKTFDAIYVGGALRSVPPILFEHLSRKNGKLVAVVGEAPAMKATLCRYVDGKLETKDLFETCCPYLIDNKDSLKKELFEF